MVTHESDAIIKVESISPEPDRMEHVWFWHDQHDRDIFVQLPLLHGFYSCFSVNLVVKPLNIFRQLFHVQG